MRVENIEPPLILTRAVLEEIMGASNENLKHGGTGDSVIYARTVTDDESGDGILEGDGDEVHMDGNGVWIDADGTRNYG
jgi:hypothetical protein